MADGHGSDAATIHMSATLVIRLLRSDYVCRCEQVYFAVIEPLSPWPDRILQPGDMAWCVASSNSLGTTRRGVRGPVWT